jgi:hypothetical protein
MEAYEFCTWLGARQRDRFVESQEGGFRIRHVSLQILLRGGGGSALIVFQLGRPASVIEGSRRRKFSTRCWPAPALRRAGGACSEAGVDLMMQLEEASAGGRPGPELLEQACQ